MSSGTGPVPPPVENCTSASWSRPAPLFLVMSSRKCRYSAGAARSYDLVWKRSVKDSPVRVSRVFQSLPSAEPHRVQSAGSRPAASFADVSAYVTSRTGSSRSNSAHPVGAKTSHLVLGSPSARFSFTSPAPLFSPLARTPVTRSVTLPGMPPR